MQSNDRLSILMQYRQQPGMDTVSALSRAAQDYPDLFPQQQVKVAQSILRRPKSDKRKVLENMAKERGIDLNTYIADLQRQAANIR